MTKCESRKGIHHISTVTLSAVTKLHEMSKVTVTPTLVISDVIHHKHLNSQNKRPHKQILLLPALTTLNVKKKRNKKSRQLKPAGHKVLLKILLKNNHMTTAT